MRLARVELALDAVPCEIFAKMLRGDGLVRRRIDGVDAEQPLQELGDLLSQLAIRRQPDSSFESAVSSFRTSHSSGNDVFDTSLPRSSTGVPCVPTTLSPITRATTW